MLVHQNHEELLKVAPALRNHHPALEQDRTQLIDQSRALPHQAVSRSMQRLHVELVLALQVDEPHCRASRRLGDPFSVAVVVLLRLYVGPDIFRATSAAHRDRERRTRDRDDERRSRLPSPPCKEEASPPAQPASRASPSGALQPCRTHQGQPRCRRSCRDQHRERRLLPKPCPNPPPEAPASLRRRKEGRAIP